MTPDDLTHTSPPDVTRDHADAALDAGLAAAFAGDTTHTRPPSADPEAGTLLAGKYRLGERIGEGGMGSVWVAHQTEPVKRRVAVKLIKPGMDSKAVLARFEAERQALAVMDHPNIARVLDGGLHEGRPYFVMELVKGVPITDYCDARKLTPQQRLELFVPVCQAIQHAHQKGVIHRDIKPSNVLVALYDDKPVPKVIDFGVAKATGGTLTDRTLETGFGAVVGTPAYMSPEQASLNNLDIDTRSDVYSLGILLYELLTGGPPFGKKELERKGLLEVLRVVREEEPPRPSVKLSTAETLPTLSANRGTEPKKLTGLLRSELDWIVMKALEKDRARRYESANGFAADVQRYLAGEPVQAHPPSAAYRLAKLARRHSGPLIAAGVVALAVLLGFAGTGVGLVEAKRQEGIARSEAEAKEKARADEADQRALADQANGELERTNGVLGKVNGTLERTNADLGKANADLTTAREKLQLALARSLLQPFADTEWRPPYRPEDRATDALSASEAQSLWRIQEAADEGVYTRLLTEAIKDPLSAQRLRLHADYILQACVGLDAARRERFERLLAAEMDDLNVTPEGRHAATVALAALGGLTPEAATQAAERYHSWALAGIGFGADRVEPWVLGAIHPPLSPAERARLMSKLWAGKQKSRPSAVRGVVFRDLALRLEEKDAIRLADNAATGELSEQAQQDLLFVIWRRLSTLPVDRQADLLFKIVRRTPVEGLDLEITYVLGKCLALAPTPDRQKWAAATVRRLLDEEEKNGGDAQIVADLTVPLIPGLDEADRAALIGPVVRVALKLLPVNATGPFFGLERVSALLPYVPAELRREVVSQVLTATEKRLSNPGRLTIGSPLNTPWEVEQFEVGLGPTLLTFLRHLDPAEGLEARKRIVAAALAGIDNLPQVADATSPQEQQHRASTIQERGLVAVHAADGAAAEREELLLLVEKKLRTTRTGLSNGWTAAWQRLSPQRRCDLLLARYATKAPADVPGVWEAFALMPELGPGERAKLCDQIVPPLKALWDKGKDGPGGLELGAKLNLVLATQYMPPRDGYTLLDAVEAGSRSFTPNTLRAYAASWAALAAELPVKDTAAMRDRLWATLRTLTQPQLDQRADQAIVDSICTLAPHMPAADREAVCLKMLEAVLKATEQRAVFKSRGEDELSLYAASSLVLFIPEADRLRMSERLRAEFLRRLYSQNDPLARAYHLAELRKVTGPVALRPIELLEPLARSGGVGARPFATVAATNNPKGTETAFFAVLHPEPESQTSLRLQAVLLAAGPPVRLEATLPAFALASTPRPCPLTDQELVDLLKHPFCVGGARRAVLDVLQERFGTPFADQWAFVKYVTDKKLPLDLEAKFPPKKGVLPPPRADK